MGMPDRKWGNGYRYGFNGKENDNDVKGEGNQQDYGMRIYDPRLGKFLSVDPLTKEYPELTPYQFASNRPIDGIDLDGKEWSKTQKLDDKGTVIVQYEVKIKVVDKDYCADQARLNQIASSTKQALATAFNDASKKNIKYEFNIKFEKVNSLDDSKDYGVVIDNNYTSEKSINGQASGNTQVGKIKLATSTISKYQKTLPGGKKSSVVVETPKSAEEIGVTLAHEMLHNARLGHPWEESIFDIKQYNKDGTRTSVSDETIKSNIMNSLGNDIPELRSTGSNRTTLTSGQVEYVDKVVEKEQKEQKKQ